MIISIYGRIRAGKTTLADMLVSEYGFVRLSFADALREIVKDYFGIDASWKANLPWNVYLDTKYTDGVNRLFSNIKGSNTKQFMLSCAGEAATKYQAYRTTLEIVGTEVFRNLVLKDIWVAVLVFKVFKHLSKDRSVVIDDTRFDDEYKALSNLNTIFVKIKSPFEEPKSNHESQKYIDGFKFDYAIDNDGSKKDLIKKFKDLNIVQVVK